jgi:hypothetical protein
MNNVQFWSRATDWKILIATGALGFSAIVGWILPDPVPQEDLRLVNSILVAGLGLLVWGVFHLIQPLRHRWRSSAREIIIVPATWLLLVVALAFLFSRLGADLDALLNTLSY